MLVTALSPQIGCWKAMLASSQKLMPRIRPCETCLEQDFLQGILKKLFGLSEWLAPSDDY